jgi:serine/threonine protein kinase/formylglycine-generating enzyme required for sulfatase activity
MCHELSDEDPTWISSYRIIRRLGQGAFGRVYLGHDDQLDRLIAIKVQRADRFSGVSDLQRFLQEARLAAQVKHPGIVTVYRIDRDPIVGWFVVLEFIEGRTLSALLRSERLTPARVAELVISVAEALSYAHEKRLVHRDLKPENILLDEYGRPHIADFGLAVHEDGRWTNRGEVAGTIPYMAPEQVRGEGHRLDGRTDLWSLGVMLYMMLTGSRPFHGDTRARVFDEILNREPVPLRQRDGRLPRELEWICLKCLSKRMTDRYATASDLADELRGWLRSSERDAHGNTPLGAAGAGNNALAATLSMTDAPTDVEPSGSTIVPIRPKGLRAFDVDDQDFFLSLLPGPRHRDGLPESLRFWTVRIEPGQHENPFSVGLLLGPSGSGKTSMVRAGLICRLSPNVIPIYLEATPNTTEARLLDALRRASSEQVTDSRLSETVAGFRSRALLAEGKRLLIVLDQFEQWLHGEPDFENANCELTRAIRQCDGVHVQCLLLVRADFAIAVARFMRALEIPLVESHNFATVDPFRLDHARKVLRAFGRAYDRYPKGEEASFERCVDHAVTRLAVDGKIAPIRLALFAQMIKDKPWTRATLREMGDFVGLGATFLEESLAGPAANPEHLLHLPAARKVLQRLLPEGGADLKGHMRSYEELLEASGYTHRPSDLDRLLEILGTELRLITPIDLQRAVLGDVEADVTTPTPPAKRYYHLTHDYLVPSLREWLTRKKRETIRGRAEIRLAERAAEWAARASRRYLPSWWEWLRIFVFTHRSSWTKTERHLMWAATGYHATRAVVLTVVLVALAIVVGEWVGASSARNAVSEFVNADARNVPTLLEELTPHRRWADPLLRGMVDDPALHHDRKSRARHGLLPVDASQGSELINRLLDDEPEEFLVIRQALMKHGHRPSLANRFRELLGNEQESPAHRFRAGMALAGLLGERDAVKDVSLLNATNFLADRLLDELLTYPERYKDWLDAMQPIRTLLVPRLSETFADSNKAEGAKFLAATMLANFARDDSGTLVELLLDANPRQFPVILSPLSRFRMDATERLTQVIHSSPSDEGKFRFVRHQANAAIALFHWGHSDGFWPLLRHSEDPLLRTYLIDRLPHLVPDPMVLLDRLAEEEEVSIRRALILILGGIPADLRSPAWSRLATERLLARYRNDSDPGIHSAVEWALRQWGEEPLLQDLPRPKTNRTTREGLSWSVTPAGYTMVTVRAPAPFLMGAPDDEEDRESDETPVLRTIQRSFSIATKEVTVRQYLAAQAELRFRNRYTNEVSKDDACPANVITWLDACKYCRWLSDKEGVEKDQMCYPPIDEIKEGMTPYPGYLSRTGYRLPTEAEWEYAARAGAVTSRFFGDDPEMLPRYGWFLNNSKARSWRGGLLLPNELGLFDVLGNLKEWTDESYLEEYVDGPDLEHLGSLKAEVDRSARGGSCLDHAHVLRTANRYHARFDLPFLGMGFRIARTVVEIPKAK